MAFDGPRCAVLFAGAGSAEPGAPFHDLDLSTGHWRVHHPCRADDYHGEFTVLGTDTWTQTWTVTGPAKSYRSVTTLTRVTGRSAPHRGGRRAARPDRRDAGPR